MIKRKILHDIYCHSEPHMTLWSDFKKISNPPRQKRKFPYVKTVKVFSVELEVVNFMKMFWSTGVDLLLPNCVFWPKNGLKMKKNAIWLKARGVFAFWGIWPSYLGEMDFNPSPRHPPIRAITSQSVLEESRSEVDDFRQFWAFVAKKCCKKC